MGRGNTSWTASLEAIIEAANTYVELYIEVNPGSTVSGIYTGGGERGERFMEMERMLLLAVTAL